MGLLFSGPIVLGQDLSNLERVLREKIAEAEREHRRNLKNSQGDDYGSNVRSGPSETERIRQERERKEEQRRHDEEVRRQREEEFKADKANLQGTLKGIDVGESSIGFCAGLRGLSDDGPNNNNQASYSKGLRGLAETSPSPNGNSNYSSGLRGYSNDYSEQYPSSTRNATTASDSRIYSNDVIKSNTNSKDSEKITNTNTVYAISSSSPHIEQHRESNRLRNQMVYQESDIHGYSSSNNASFNSISRIGSSVEYTRYVVINKPEPVYYQGPGTSFFRMDLSEESKEPILDRIEQRIDIWREAGEHKVLTYVGDQLTGLARKTISSSSAIGSQVVKVYDIVKDIAGVKNMEMNIINRSIEASKKSIITGNPDYVNEVNQVNHKEVQSYLNNYMENKGYIPPSSRKLDKKGQDVTKKVAETWVRSRIIK